MTQRWDQCINKVHVRGEIRGLFGMSEDMCGEPHVRVWRAVLEAVGSSAWWEITCAGPCYAKGLCLRQHGVQQ